eukprot:TRINITY_DN36987_c2_g1_i2.p1 TRINITY_DN36987_c2_g1~~TRINITY_DN36987_c2_g1_i2.p1  ORF type:complete len:333 (-),score=38.46 TRINITY_DN36987_c2_g1_i2:115-1113(-)
MLSAVAPNEIEVEIPSKSPLADNSKNSSQVQPQIAPTDNDMQDTQWFNNIITQVNSRNSTARFYRLETTDEVNPNAKIRKFNGRTNNGFRISSQTWRKKIRYLLCCFHPATIDYSTAELDDVIDSDTAGDEGSRQDNLIGPVREEDKNKKTLVLDLDETLVHSSFQPLDNADYIIPVEVEGVNTDVYVLRRPHLDHFLEEVCQRFEVVVFTASLSKYADPLLDLLDERKMVRWRLFRESCVNYQGAYVKDLARLGRELRNVLIVDNSPNSYIFQPENAIPILAFIDDTRDQALLELLSLLVDLQPCYDVRDGLRKWQRTTSMVGTQQIGVNV